MSLDRLCKCFEYIIYMNDTIIMSVWMFFVSYFAISTILPENTPFHLNKLFMALQMVGYMNVMAFFMTKNYYLALAAALFTIIMTYILREQIFISERQFLSGMTEHHQMALLMADKIRVKYPISQFTQTLSGNILTGQQKEINDIKKYLANNY